MSKEHTIDLKEVTLDTTDKLVMMPCSQDNMEIHTHHFFELVYVTSGSTNHTLNGISSKLETGDYFIVDYGSKHSYEESKELTLINCLFLPEVIDETLSGCHSFDALMHCCLIKYYTPSFGETPVNRIFHDQNGSILHLLLGMQKEYFEKQAGYTEIFRCRLVELMILTLRSGMKHNKKQPKTTAILEVIHYIDKQYQTSVKLSTFCEEHHYSLQYISKRFKQETGLTVQEYLQKVRIKKSCELLAGSSLRISEVAQAVGYNDTKFFQTIFKRFVKVSPREYRRLSNSLNS